MTLKTSSIMVKHREKKVMVRKLKRYNRLKGLVGAILEYMEAPSSDKYEAIKALGYKDITIKMYIRTISIYLNSKDKRKGVTESLFNLVDELRKSNTTYIAPVKTLRTVDRHELKRLVPPELERVIPIMYKYKNEGSKKVLELCEPSTYKDSTLLKYLQGVRYYCKYRRDYYKNNSAISSIIDKIEAKGGLTESKYEKLKNKEPRVSLLIKYLLAHTNEDYRSCLSYAVNELGYSLTTAKVYVMLFRKYIQYGIVSEYKGNRYVLFYKYVKQYAKDYNVQVKEEPFANKRYNYLYRLTQMYLNNVPLDKLSTTEVQDIGSIILYCDKGFRTLILAKEDYRDLNKIIRELKKEAMSTSRIPLEVNNKEGNLSMTKKRSESWGKPLTYEKYKEIAEMMKEIILNDEGPLDKEYFMKEYNLTYSQVRKLYSSLRCYMNKHSTASYRVAKAWNKAIKEVVNLSESVKEVKSEQTKNEIAEQEPTCADTLNIKAGVIWNGFCSLLDNREQAIGFQKALKAFNVTNSHICRVTMEDPYNYEAIDEE